MSENQEKLKYPVDSWDCHIGSLCAVYIGVMEWRTHAQVPTCNVFHVYSRLPAATFHDSGGITFRNGVVWYPDTLKELQLLHAEWQIYCSE